MDALKKAEAANKHRTEIPPAESESLELTGWESLTLPEESSETTEPVIADSFDWLNAEIALPETDGVSTILLAAPTDLSLEISELITEQESLPASEEPEFFDLEDFVVEDPAEIPDLDTALLSEVAPEEPIRETPPPEKIDPLEFTSPPVTNPTITPPTWGSAELCDFNIEPPVTNPTQETAQRLFNVGRAPRNYYRTSLYSLLGLGVIGLLAVYVYSFMFTNTPSVGLNRYPINSNTHPAPTSVAVTNNIANPAALPVASTITVNNTSSVTTPALTSPVTSAPNPPPNLPSMPVLATPSETAVEKTAMLPNVPLKSDSNNFNIQKTAKTVAANKSAPDAKMPVFTPQTESLNGVVGLKKEAVARTNQEINSAYQALQRGELSRAERSYQQVLKYDARNRDSLLGLAAIALQQGKNAQAQQYYQQILEIYPQDNLAQAGLISSLGESSPESSVSQLKILLGQLPPKAENLPQIAYLQFTLGNTYARQQAWTEAQQAYFEAFRSEPRADYAYNLAISLDQLHQYATAASYYQQALQWVNTREKTSFDRNAATQRLRELNAARTTPSSTLIE